MERISRLSAINNHFEGNMTSEVKTITLDGSNYNEIIDF